MQKMGGGRNTLAAARVAFALLAPAVAGCVPSPRAPVSEVCVSENATLQESREAVLSSIERITGLSGTLLDRIRKVERLVERLPSGMRGGETLGFVMAVHLPIAGDALLGMKETIEWLREGILEAGEDAGSMRILAQRACAALETAEDTVESCTHILDFASADIRGVGKE
jgi:hypothetical protein